MAASETPYSVPAASPVVYARARAQRDTLPVWRAGELVVPTVVGYRLLSPGGTELVAVAGTEVGGIGGVSLTAEQLPATLGYGQGYVAEWSLTLEGVVRVYRRAVTLGRFELAAPLGEAELVAGSYPDLLDHATGAFGGSWQPILDQAWSTILRWLWAQGTPATVIVDAGPLFDWYRDLALHRIFSALYAADPTDRWDRLREQHRIAAELGPSRVKLLEDLDSSGTADDLAQRSPARPIHPNAAPRARWGATSRGRW